MRRILARWLVEAVAAIADGVPIGQVTELPAVPSQPAPGEFSALLGS
jgi:hypothetical protein